MCVCIYTHFILLLFKGRVIPAVYGELPSILKEANLSF